MAEKVKLSAQCEDCREAPVLVRPKRRYKKCEDCRRTDIIHRLAARRVKRTLSSSIGKLVQYNRGDGWRAGYLLSMGLHRASIQPIGAKGQAPPDVMAVALQDIKAETLQSASAPTVEDYYRMSKKTIVLVAAPGRFAAAVDTAVQTMASSTVPEQHLSVNAPPAPVETKPRTSKHSPFDPAEAIRLYQLGIKMSAIVEAVRGTRATGATGNLVRDALRKAGIYKEPTK